VGGNLCRQPAGPALPALAVIEVLRGKRNLLARSVTLGEMIMGRLRDIAVPGQAHRDVRGLGARWLACERFTAECRADAEWQAKVVALARDKGDPAGSAGQYGNVDRILVPRTASDMEVSGGYGYSSLPFRPAGRLTRPAVFRLTGARKSNMPLHP